MAKLIKAKVLEKIKRTPTIESIRFFPQENLGFLPGQFLQLVFDEANLDNRNLNKYLSFSASPNRDYIEVTKRLSGSAFSQRLKGLSVGDEVLLKGPMGNCVFNEEYKKLGFLIGGIGITPVISIIEYTIDNKLDVDIVLFYSNRVEEEIAFREQLDNWQKINPNLKIFYAITECQPKDKVCIVGHITQDLLADKIKDWGERHIFIFGPPNMVQSMCSLCFGMSCAKENVKTETFIGY